jgi:hypothetical protein
MVETDGGAELLLESRFSRTGFLARLAFITLTATISSGLDGGPCTQSPCRPADLLQHFVGPPENERERIADGGAR